MKNSDLRTRARGDVGEFERDITTADEDNSFWQLLQLEKLIAFDQVLLAGNPQRSWSGASSDEDEAPDKLIISNLKSCRIEEASAAMERRDPSLDVSALLIFGNGFCESILELHERRPVYLTTFCRNAFPFHASGPVDQLCRAHEHFFWIAAAQRASTA